MATDEVVVTPVLRDALALLRVVLLVELVLLHVVRVDSVVVTTLGR